MRPFVLVVLAVFLINAGALVASAYSSLKTGPSNDEVVISEGRLNDLKDHLPAGAIVGYVTDGEVMKGELLRLDDCRRFYMTQYALAPHLVVRETNKDYVVGNFSSEEAARATLPGLTVEKDFGNGVILMRGTESSSPGKTETE